MGLRSGAQRVPQLLLRDGDREPDRRALDHALVPVAHVAPELRARGVRAAREARDPALVALVFAAPCQQRREPPDGAREPLELRGDVVVVRRGVPEVDARAPGRGVRC